MGNDANILTGQYLAFTLRDEEFAIDIFKVREVVDVTAMTRIPRMPEYMAGVINLRSNVVPVMDLGLKLDMKPIARDVNSCIMIVEVEVSGEERPVIMGVLADAVLAVMDLDADDIEPVPRMGTNLNADFIKGMGRQGEKFLILLDIDRILTSEGEAVLRDMEGLDKAGEAAAASESV